MNVLSRGQVPNVLSLRDVLQRMARPPPGRAGAPLAASASARSSTGSRCSTAISIAYLNLDEVIRIVRYEDEPKAS